MDFSTDAIDITFPADEGDSLTLQFDVDVPIVDDQIDEADREYFILHLSVVDDPLPELVLGTTVSVGEIADNDGIILRALLAADTNIICVFNLILHAFHW